MERKKQSMWKTFALAFCLLLSLETGGCVRQEKKSSEQHELEIKIVTEEEIPEELMSLIEKNKKNPWTGSAKHRKQSISIPVFSDRKKEKKKRRLQLILM